jgi:hypothetical protein
MFKPKLLAAMSVGLIAGACSGPYDRQAAVPSNTSRAATPAERICLDYGFDRGTQRFDNCVTREVEAHRYREQNNTPGPQPYAANYAPASVPAPYVEPRAATTGTEVSRDEFGFRYDAEGNRLDRNGRIISPQSTTP